ncbi:FAD-binding protein [Candidatus Dojkabacteria bacterium]|nr:FAD-binding protein [Candidatus Dojkabacteria bacterium]
MDNIAQLKTKLAELGIEFKENEPLAPYTTYKIGGPADIFSEIKNSQQLKAAVTLAIQLKVPYTIIGWGSNVLIADKGIRGLVIKNSAGNIAISEKENIEISQIETADVPEPRLDEIDKDKLYTFEDLDYDESDAPIVKVNIESGASLPVTIMNLIRNGITGLQWFGGIPGTIGGAIFNNIHGGTHYLAEYVDRVEVLDKDSLETRWLSNSECKFDYDYSIFHEENDLILSADFNLRKGDKEKAKQVYVEWTRRKKLQPQKSAGCVWQNISNEEKERLGLESTSWGYIIDRVLNLKGKQIGGAKISEAHAAFIENTGGAKAQDVVELMELIKKEAVAKLGIEPKSEVFLLGEF